MLNFWLRVCVVGHQFHQLTQWQGISCELDPQDTVPETAVFPGSGLVSCDVPRPSLAAETKEQEIGGV